MSPSGDPLVGNDWIFSDSGFGIPGMGGTTDECRLVRDEGALFRLRGDVDFVGDAGSSGNKLWSASNIWDGSTEFPAFVLRPRVPFLGEGASLRAML